VTPRRLAAAAVLALVALPARADPAIDPDDLAAMLADLEAHGGVLTDADLALLPAEPVEPIAPGAPASAGRGYVAFGARDQSPAQVRAGLAAQGGHWSFAAAARHGDGGMLGSAWVRGEGSTWRLDGGGGAVAHGAGLLAAPLGARATLGTDTSLLPGAAGWRPSLGATAPERLVGVALGARTSRVEFDASVARDLDGTPAGHLRAGGHGASASLAALVIRRGDARGASADLRWRGGPWTLAAEAAAWRSAPAAGLERAWLAAGGWRSGRLRVEFQAGSARAATPLPGACRPSCLTGWLGQGWALRLVTRSSDRLHASAVAAVSGDREPESATGRRHARDLLGIAVGGRWGGEDGSWDVRLRRIGETWRGWAVAEPWLPAAEDGRRQRTWLAAQVERPLAVGRGRLAWRRLEEAGQARDLLAATVERAWGSRRWRAGAQFAWGAPLDLVAVSAPVGSFVRLHHWGSWDSSVLMGCEGRGAWSWQIGLELRRRTALAGGGVAGELRTQCGRAF